MQDPKTCLLEWNPPLHPHWPRAVLFLAAFQVGRPSEVLPPRPLRPQNLLTDRHLFSLLAQHFFPSSIFHLTVTIPTAITPVLSVAANTLAGRCAALSHRSVFNKRFYVKSMISSCRCGYHLVPGCSFSVLSRRCCLYLKHSSCSVWFPYYSLPVDHETKHMKLSGVWGILPPHIRLNEGIDGPWSLASNHNRAISLVFFLLILHDRFLC